MQLGLVGWNHRTAPVAFRERLYFAARELPAALPALKAAGPYAEAAIVSTCNRVELLVVAPAEAADLGDFPAAARRWLAGAKGVPEAELEPRSYVHRGDAAARHLFEVAAALDALVPGEPEILGQVRAAAAAARAAGTLGPVLGALFERAARAARAIRAGTDLGRGKASVGSAAVELAGKIFGDFAAKRVVLFGTGEVGVRILEHLATAGAKQITVVSRSAERARSLAARFGARSAGYERRDELLGEAEIVLTAAAAPHAVLRRAELAELLARRSSPLCIIDVAVPRNVEPELSGLPQVYLYNIDDLEAVVRRTLHERESARVAAVPLVERELDGLHADLAARAAREVVRALRERFHQVRQAELHEHADWLAALAPDAREQVERLTRHLVDCLLHAPSVELEHLEQDGAADAAGAAFRLAARLFRLDAAVRPDPDAPPPEGQTGQGLPRVENPGS